MRSSLLSISDSRKGSLASNVFFPATVAAGRWLLLSLEQMPERLELVVELRSATASRIEQALVTHGGTEKEGLVFFWWKFWMSSSKSAVYDDVGFKNVSGLRSRSRDLLADVLLVKAWGFKLSMPEGMIVAVTTLLVRGVCPLAFSTFCCCSSGSLLSSWPKLQPPQLVP
uniref:Uncharacterized protein n=1 Tax=Rhizophora mucronata TaxID=61149 RepID=A0A2P2LQE3_RHIMU